MRRTLSLVWRLHHLSNCLLLCIGSSLLRSEKFLHPATTHCRQIPFHHYSPSNLSITTLPQHLRGMCVKEFDGWVNCVETLLQRHVTNTRSASGAGIAPFRRCVHVPSRSLMSISCHVPSLRKDQLSSSAIALRVLESSGIAKYWNWRSSTRSDIREATTAVIPFSVPQNERFAKLWRILALLML